MPDLLFRPEQPTTHRLEYSTDVLPNFKGLEQRIARLLVPKQSVDMRFLFDTKRQVRQFRTELFRNLNSVWRVPIWWKPEFPDSLVSSGSFTWPFDTASTPLVSGDSVYITAPGDSPRGIFTVATVNPNDIVTVQAANGDFARGTRIYKLQDMKFRPTPQFGRAPTDPEQFVTTMDFVDLIDIGGENATVPTFQASDDVVARQLLDRRPLANNIVDYSVDAFLDRIEFGRNFEQFTALDELFFIERKTYLIQGRPEQQFWEKFLELIVGQREPFYTPTFREDLRVLTQPFVGSSPPWGLFDVADESADETDDLDYPGQWFPSVSHKSLRFDTDLGEQYKEVDTAIDNMDTTITLTLLSGLTPNSIIEEISFLERVRLAGDVITFQHFDQHSTIEFSTRTIQQ